MVILNIILKAYFDNTVWHVITDYVMTRKVCKSQPCDGLIRHRGVLKQMSLATHGLKLVTGPIILSVLS